jgi:hypothetical protein
LGHGGEDFKFDYVPSRRSLDETTELFRIDDRDRPWRQAQCAAARDVAQNARDHLARGTQVTRDLFVRRFQNLRGSRTAQQVSGDTLPATGNDQFAAHFKDVLPAFEHHLAMTIDAAKALGVPTEN